VVLVWGLIHGYAGREGDGVDFRINTGLWGGSEAVGLFWGLIQGYWDGAGQWVSLGIDTGLWGESRAVGFLLVIQVTQAGNGNRDPGAVNLQC